MSKVIWTVICIVILCGSTLANDVKINGEASVQPLDETTAQISFKVSWEHSWREGENWDAIWVFVKYKRRGVNEPWHHAYLKDSDNNRVASAAGVPAMQVLAVTSTENWAQRMDTLYFGNDIPNTVRGLDRKVVPGVLIFRKKPGTGNIVNAPVRLEWDFNEGDLNLYSEITRQDIRDGKIEISVQAIEMVYVPVGPYYLGDRLSAYSFINEGADGALRISSDDEQMLYRMGITAGSTYDKAWKVPDLFPMGYTGFYAMKYKGGSVASGKGVRRADLLVEGEKVVSLGRGLKAEAERTIDVTGCVLFPGFIDAHTHFDLEVAGTVTADGFASGSRAALRGGTTTVIDFACPNKGESLASGLERWREKAVGKTFCDYGFHMTIDDWNEGVRAELPEMFAQGISSFKLYMTYPAMLLGDRDLYWALKELKTLGGICGVHCENAGVIDGMIAEKKALVFFSETMLDKFE